jgi:AraC-like DNA-binding protein
MKKGEAREEVTMHVMAQEPSEREAEWMQANRKELVERTARVMHEDGTKELLPGLTLSCSSKPTAPLPGVFEPAVCMIAQGSKEVLFGDSRCQFDPLHYLLVTLDLPYVSQVLEASKEQPFLSLRLSLSSSLVGSVLLEAGHTQPPEHGDARAIDVSLLDGNLLDAFVRLVRLLDAPTEAQVLQPLITREIIYRLLMREQGGRLRHLTISGGYTPSIARAVKLLLQDFDQPLRIKQLARELGMSVSSLQHRFKAVTAMSPQQFQKQLRLQEARRLLLSEDLDAKGAASRVGYQDATHFNREYKSLFGVPPMRDVQRLREAAQNQASR